MMRVSGKQRGRWAARAGAAGARATGPPFRAVGACEGGSALQLQSHLELERARERKLEDWQRRTTGERLNERFGAGAFWLPYRLYNG